MLLGYAVSKTDGSQSPDLERRGALRTIGRLTRPSTSTTTFASGPPRRPAGSRQLPAGGAEGRRARGLKLVGPRGMRALHR